MNSFKFDGTFDEVLARTYSLAAKQKLLDFDDKLECTHSPNIDILVSARNGVEVFKWERVGGNIKIEADISIQQINEFLCHLGFCGETEDTGVRIKPQTGGDCGTVALAYLLGMTYDEARKLYPHDGLNEDELIGIALDHNIALVPLNDSLMQRFELSPALVLKIKDSGLWHIAFTNNGVVYDSKLISLKEWQPEGAYLILKTMDVKSKIK